MIGEWTWAQSPCSDTHVGIYDDFTSLEHVGKLDILLNNQGAYDEQPIRITFE